MLCTTNVKDGDAQEIIGAYLGTITNNTNPPLTE